MSKSLWKINYTGENTNGFKFNKDSFYSNSSTFSL